MVSDEIKAIQLRIVEKEDDEYRKWKREKQAPIPLTLALQMYELYLNGYSCEEIWRVNAQRYPLGQIVDAKIRYDWDERKDTQLATLYGNIEKKVLHVKHEAVSHLADLLSAAHKIWGDKVAQFLQEGDMNLLVGFDPSTVKNYKEILGMLQLLTAQKESKDVKVGGTVEHVHSQAVDAKKKMSSGAASDFLASVDAEYTDGK